MQILLATLATLVIASIANTKVEGTLPWQSARSPTGLTGMTSRSFPDNIASQRACLKAGARYVDTVAVPVGHDLYSRGSREMQRYRLKVRSA